MLGLVQGTLEEPGATCSPSFIPAQSHYLLTPTHTCSHHLNLLAPAHTRSPLLFTPSPLLTCAHPCSHPLTPVHYLLTLTTFSPPLTLAYTDIRQEFLGEAFLVPVEGST